MNRKGLFVLLFSFITGYLMWQLSELLTGRVEAFDSPIYVPILLLVGVISCQRPLLSYIGVVLGQQAVFNFLSGKLWIVGFFLIFIYCLATPVAAFLTKGFIQNQKEHNRKQS